MAKEEKQKAKVVKDKKSLKQSSKNVKKTQKKSEVKENYFKGVKKELALVKWPTWKEVIKNTIATVVLIIIVVGYFLLLNLGLSVIKGWFV